MDFTVYYNGWRHHMALGGAFPDTMWRGQPWRKPYHTDKAFPVEVECVAFADQRVTAYRLARGAQRDVVFGPSGCHARIN